MGSSPLGCSVSHTASRPSRGRPPPRLRPKPQAPTGGNRSEPSYAQYSSNIRLFGTFVIFMLARSSHFGFLLSAFSFPGIHRPTTRISSNAGPPPPRLPAFLEAPFSSALAGGVVAAGPATDAG